MTWIRTLTSRERLLAVLAAVIVAIGAVAAAAATGGSDDGSVATSGSSTTLRSTTSSTASSSTSSPTSSPSTTSTTSTTGVTTKGSTATTVRSGGGTATTKPPTTTPPTAPPTTTCNLPADSGYASQLASQFDAHRAQLGRPAMTRTSGLNSVALGWARWMACTHNTALNHNPDYPSQVYAACGACTGSAENVAYNSGPASAMWSSWINSEIHRNNIQNAKAGEYGIAVVKGTDGNYYGVQDFGRYP